MSTKARTTALRTHVEGGVEFLRIERPDRMDPFLMTLASDTDCWAYVCSSGGMTAGRVDPDGALFPYETVDRLLQSHRTTGPITLLRVGATVWEPFTADVLPAGVERTLDKSVLGHQLVVTETHRELGLRVRARWASCDRFGHVRSVTLENLSTEERRVEVLDGMRGLLPFGAELGLYQMRSCLVDAYKQVDVDRETGLATVALTSRVIDRPQAAEMLRANVVWQTGLDGATIHLQPETPLRFRQGLPLEPEHRLEGRPAGYFLQHELRLGAGESRRWHLAADVGCDHQRLSELRTTLSGSHDLEGRIESALRASGESLAALLASADGFQCTSGAVEDDHHLANVLFNTMRGGVFWRGHLVPRDDFLRFVESRHRRVHDSHAAWIASLEPEIEVQDLVRRCRERKDASLERLALEYLPLYFGRRHGDPSRPWNLFRIRVRESDGSPALDYQGNWRDIFQNWEALALSFPAFLPGMIAKFVNASTVDGFNPYRITRDGIDWEVEDPDDPWSFIGYWGDHQIIYLLKLVEAMARFDPEGFEAMLPRRVYATARVPYRLRDYESIARDPHHTIEFDGEADRDVADKVEKWGTDGRLLLDAKGEAVHVSLYEKLLIPALSKLSNLVADAGIWMNTQRPEWNDANNALVGNGVSMVTLCYLRRYLDHLRPVFARAEKIEVSKDVCVWLDEIRGVLERFRKGLAEEEVDDGTRRALLDALGGAFERYRRQAYDVAKRRFEVVEGTSVTDLFRLASEYLDHAIAANWREDGLLHSYNLLKLSEGRAEIDRLPVMLEGQVAALSSGAVGAERAVRMVDSLFSSPLYREDQKSFLLYPAATLPTFYDRNRVETERAEAIELVRALHEARDASILARDADGRYRFHGDFADARDLDRALDALESEERWAERVRADRAALLDLFERTFDHHAFTGRSGTMYGYEGLGCIYWHMISKLLLAIQEIALALADERRFDGTFHDLARAYYRVREGLGSAKTPDEFGAFPTDPYSHTPAHAGAQQPGMTGQVKEEILTRFGEFGVRMEEGQLAFRPSLLRRDEFRMSPGRYESVDASGAPVRRDVPPGALAFSLVQVPVIYRLENERRWVRVHDRDGGVREMEGSRLDLESTRSLLGRQQSIAWVEVGVLASDLLTFDR